MATFDITTKRVEVWEYTVTVEANSLAEANEKVLAGEGDDDTDPDYIDTISIEIA